MVTVTIGGNEYKADEISEGWLAQLIQRYRKDDAAMCVRVSLENGYVHMTLSSGACPTGGGGGGGGGRAPNAQERAILDLWSKLGLDETTFPPGSLIAFLKQVA